jgi:hypothetical protein
LGTVSVHESPAGKFRILWIDSHNPSGSNIKRTEKATPTTATLFKLFHDGGIEALERAAIPRPSLEKQALQSPDTKSKGAVTVRFNAIDDLDDTPAQECFTQAPWAKIKQPPQGGLIGRRFNQNSHFWRIK